MSTKSVETTLKVRKALHPNHNESALKVCKNGPIGGNHNQTALKVRKAGAIGINHNETTLKMRQSLGLKVSLLALTLALGANALLHTSFGMSVPDGPEVASALPASVPDAPE